MFKWLRKRKARSKQPEQPIVIGDWRSDYVEERRTGDTRYRANNLEGVKQILQISADGRGGATLNWYVPGLHFKLSAYLPLEYLVELSKEAKTDA